MSCIRIFAAGLTAATLAGCAISNDQSVPDDVTFVGGRLSVTFSNGMTCRSEGIVGSTSGTFQHCPIPVRYDVAMRAQTWLPAGWAEPQADITITMPDGRTTLLKTPQSRNWTGNVHYDDSDEFK